MRGMPGTWRRQAQLHLLCVRCGHSLKHAQMHSVSRPGAPSRLARLMVLMVLRNVPSSLPWLGAGDEHTGQVRSLLEFDAGGRATQGAHSARQDPRHGDHGERALGNPSGMQLSPPPPHPLAVHQLRACCGESLPHAAASGSGWVVGGGAAGLLGGRLGRRGLQWVVLPRRTTQH